MTARACIHMALKAVCVSQINRIYDLFAFRFPWRQLKENTLDDLIRTVERASAAEVPFERFQ